LAFLDKHAGSIQYISYRHFIEHALHDFLTKYHNVLKDSCKEECKSSFKKFLEAFRKNENYPEDESALNLPIRLYWLKCSEKYAVLIDHSKWCFPLVIDSDGRASGLEHAIDNINNNIDKILKALNENIDREWDEKLQEKMDKFDDRNEKPI